MALHEQDSQHIISRNLKGDLYDIYEISLGSAPGPNAKTRMDPESANTLRGLLEARNAVLLAQLQEEKEKDP